jgi:hypothetical protein
MKIGKVTFLLSKSSPAILISASLSAISALSVILLPQDGKLFQVAIALTVFFFAVVVICEAMTGKDSSNVDNK